MARRILKFKLYPVHKLDSQLNFKTALPAGLIMRAVQVQGDMLCLWAECSTDADMVNYGFTVYGTGDALDMNHVYLTTIQHHLYVWHIYAS